MSQLSREHLLPAPLLMRRLLPKFVKKWTRVSLCGLIIILFQPELGVSPVDPFPVSSLPRHNQLERKRRDETKYLSSSEMYRVRLFLFLVAKSSGNNN